VTCVFLQKKYYSHRLGDFLKIYLVWKLKQAPRPDADTKLGQNNIDKTKNKIRLTQQTAKYIHHNADLDILGERIGLGFLVFSANVFINIGTIILCYPLPLYQKLKLLNCCYTYVICTLLFQFYYRHYIITWRFV